MALVVSKFQLSGIFDTQTGQGWIGVWQCMICEERFDNALDDFRYYKVFGNGLIVGKFVFIELRFLKKRRDCLSWGQTSPVARLRLTIRVITGAKMLEQCLRGDVGRASRPHCLLGQARINLKTSSTVAGVKTLEFWRSSRRQRIMKRLNWRSRQWYL